jgi:hypothetical protein
MVGLLHNLKLSARRKLRPADTDTAGRQQRRHPGFVHPNADAKAGDARLSHLEKRGADLISVADACKVVGQSFDCEVLAKLAVILFNCSCQ